ncbi:MAG: histidinol dehydrogenase, partial [Atopobiaceae bacterium]|nr:histidinol dehydrogenase [Atopobiaceae bacterium]
MRTIRLTGDERLTRADLDRSGALPRSIMDAAEAIVDDVRARGDEAVREYCLRFDGSCPDSFRVPDEVVQGALDMVDPEFLQALKLAANQIRDFHEREREQSWFTTRPDGTILGVKVTPVPSAAVYVPGGRAQYPSTVLMDTLPAKVAGVPRVVMVTPPQKDGSLSAYTLAAAAVACVDEVYAVGGAQAIGAVAYGTESIPQVAKIVGPGNAYVASAKRYVSGDVGIDMIAGPSEVCVLADGTADPAIVAADLMAQAEHDPLAACYLVTDAPELPKEVLEAIEVLVSQSPREDITRASLADKGVIVACDSLDAAIDAVNLIAPEHLELHCADAFSLLGRIQNAGAIFVGPWSSEPLGDYVAGPNHTLPTGGTALFSNPLGVYDFQKRSSVISYTREGLRKDGPSVQTLAQAEGLWAHALSVGMRLRLEDGQECFADP